MKNKAVSIVFLFIFTSLQSPFILRLALGEKSSKESVPLRPKPGVESDWFFFLFVFHEIF